MAAAAAPEGRQDECEKAVEETKSCVTQSRPVQLVLTLSDVYGWKLLGMLSVGLWGLKGFVWGFSAAAMEFLFREYGANGPRMQVYKAVVMLPWAMKPIFGLISDAVPIFGFRKAPYICLASFFAIGAYLTIGLAPAQSLPIQTVIVALLLGCAQVSIVDLLVEAAYSEKIREHPENGPELISFVWGGITVGGLLATASVGFIIEHYGAQAVYTVVVIPAAIVLIPTCCNWLEEKKLTSEEVSRHRASLWEQREVMLLVLLMGASTAVLVAVGLLQDSVWVNLYVGMAIAFIVVGAFTLLLSPVIGKVNCFFFIQTCCVIDISGASFYFFTDGPAEYPEGPHFSKVFYASGLGVFLSMLNLFGLWVYNQTMKDWRYHQLLIFANLLQCAAGLLGLLVYTRWNVAMGIPDTFFVLGTMGAWSIVHMWMWMPGVVLLSQLCPKGVEATMYALLAGCHNLGLTVASYVGACVLVALDVRPRGAVGESAAFEKLWVAALVQSVAPALTLVVLPWMVPNARQTEKLLEETTSSVEGSPWQRLVGAREVSFATQAQQPGYGAT
jgi:folate/biopterin transporter